MKPRRESDSRGGKKTGGASTKTTCTNKECKLRKAGCTGAESCPGYKSP